MELYIALGVMAFLVVCLWAWCSSQAGCSMIDCPVCYGSGPSPQTQAEHSCDDCYFQDECFKKLPPEWVSPRRFNAGEMAVDLARPGSDRTVYGMNVVIDPKLKPGEFALTNGREKNWLTMREWLMHGEVALQDLGVPDDYVQRVQDDLVKFGRPRF